MVLPTFGNDNPKVDDIAVKVTRRFYEELDKQKLYKNAKATKNVIKMDRRGRSKPPTNLYSTRPPQNIFPTHTVNYLPHSHWKLPLPQNLHLSYHSSPLTNLFYHPGLNIRDIAKPYSSTPTNSLSKHCVSFVLTLLWICTLLSLWFNFMFNLRVLAHLFTPFVIVQLQYLSHKQSSLSLCWNLPWFISPLTKPPTVSNPHEFS